MDKFLSINAKQFTFYSLSHIAVLIFISLSSLMIIIFNQRLKNAALKKYLKFIIPSLIVLFLIADLVWLSSNGIFDLKYHLPLHLCDLTYLLVILLFITDKKIFFEIVYFLGVGSSIQALLTPGLIYEFPHLIFFYFFFYHGIVIFAAVYYAFTAGYKINFFSVIRAFIALNIFGMIMLLINYFLKSNYMFLSEKPFAGSLMDIMGPWPYYIAVADVLAFINCLILYIPYFIYNITNKKTNSAQ